MLGVPVKVSGVSARARSRSLPIAVTVVLVVALGCGRAVPAASAQEQRSAVPSFNYTAYGGCQNIIVFASNQAETEVLSVFLNIDRKAPPTAARPLRIDLSKLAPLAGVELRRYAGARHFMPCSDVLRREGQAIEPAVIWTARKGTVTVSAVAPASESAEYPVSVQITGAVFEGPNGQTVTQPRPLIINAVVGRLVGG